MTSMNHRAGLDRAQTFLFPNGCRVMTPAYNLKRVLNL